MVRGQAVKIVSDDPVSFPRPRTEQPYMVRKKTLVHSTSLINPNQYRQRRVIFWIHVQ